MYICGSFKSKEAGRAFVYRMTKEFSVEAQIEVAFEGDIAAFCEKYPGKTITLTSHDWDKYDHTWGYGHWNVSTVCTYLVASSVGCCWEPVPDFAWW